jgi:O-antigen/teichoic acid export membrane protein
LFGIACGSVVLLLVMTGFERDAAISVAISVVLAIILNPIFITRWGINGAALANATGLILWNMLMVMGENVWY